MHTRREAAGRGERAGPLDSGRAGGGGGEQSGAAHRRRRQHPGRPGDPRDAHKLVRHEPLQHRRRLVEMGPDVAEAVEAPDLLPLQHAPRVLQHVERAGVVGRLEQQLEVRDALGDGLDSAEQLDEGEEVLAADMEAGDADGRGHQALVERADEVPEALHLVARLGDGCAQLLRGFWQRERRRG